jgi:glycosyltransferase involved in cell wall biosynthesis
VDAEPSTAGAPRISVVVCTLNGAKRIEKCLAAVRRQSLRERLQLIVVDDGSTDDSAEVAASYGAEVIRHPANRGLAAARNTGIAVARAPIIATLDDDCEPEPEWAERLLSGFVDGVVGVGGPALPASTDGYFGGYLERNNPLAPLEIDLASNTHVTYRFARYLLRNARPAPSGGRAVHAFATANGAFRAAVLRQLGGFDERFRSDEGGEDLDLCLRIGDEHAPGALRFEPSAIIRHHFDTDPRAILRRNRSYGMGAARLYCKRRNLPPTVFPFPVLVAGLLAWSRGRASRLTAALFVPQLLFSNGCRNALQQRSATPLLDCYVKLAEEANLNLGFAVGLWRFRNRRSIDTAS